MATLTIIQPTGEREEIPFSTDEVTIGRASDNTVVVGDPGASSHHCRIVREGTRFTLHDLNSTNGTLVNGDHVTECALAPSDIIMVGTIKITLGAAPETGSAAPFPPTGPENTIRIPRTPTEFAVRPRRTGMFIGVGIVIALGLGALITWFVRGLMGG